MKLNPNYTIREIAGEKVIIPLGKETKKFNGLITANSVAITILENINKLETEDEIVRYIIDLYDVSEEEAIIDVKGFIKELINFGIIIK